MRNKRKGFTLIELLIVIGILSVLAVAVILVINPSELFKRARDSVRISDMNTLQKVFVFAEFSGGYDKDGPNYADSCEGESDKKIFISVPSDNGEPDEVADPGWTYVRTPSATLRNLNGTGWLPVDFTTVAASVGGTLLSVLPVDPSNTFASGKYYSYRCGSYEATTGVESEKYKELAANDGGFDPNRYEVSSGITEVVAFYDGSAGGTAPVVATVLSDNFQSYTPGINLPTGGTWAGTGPAGLQTVEQGANSEFAVLRASAGGVPNQITSVAVDTSSYDSAELTFNLRYTGNDGDAQVDNTSDGSVVFNEMDNSVDNVAVQYSTNGSTFTTLQTFTYNDTAYSNGFVPVTISLPAEAITPTLQVRFTQPNETGTDTTQDQYAIDSAVIVATAGGVVTPPSGPVYATSLFEDFESYTAAANIVVGGNWDAVGPTGAQTVEQGVSAKYAYMRASVGGIPNSLTTKTLDTSGYSSGGTISFKLRFTGNNGDASVDNLSDGSIHFDEFDNSNDNIEIQYSTDGGSTFNTFWAIPYDDTSGRNAFGTFSSPLPRSALASGVQFRITQPRKTDVLCGGTYCQDSYAVDDISISSGLSIATSIVDDFESYGVVSHLPTTDIWADSGGLWTSASVVQGATSNFLQLKAADYSGNPNFVMTKYINTSNYVNGTVSFKLRYTNNNGDFAVDSFTDGGATFDEFDSLTDNIVVDYTTNGGATYTTLQTFAYDDGVSYRTAFVPVSIALPPAAKDYNLRIRIIQPAQTNWDTSKDQYGIDDFMVQDN